MKKVTVFIVLLTLFIGCDQKEEISIDSIEVVIKDLKLLADADVDYSCELTPYSDNNPYDEWGEAFYKGFDEAIQKRQEKMKSGNSITDNFRMILNSTIQKEFSIIDTTGVNFENVNAIIEEFISMYANRNEFDEIQISHLMEEYIFKTTLVPEDDKVFVLKTMSIIRYGSFYITSNQTKSKGGAFEDCWIEGLQVLQDSGPITQIACAFSWPLCFGAILADCAIEVL